METLINKPSDYKVHYIIVSEEMVWQFYYDEFGSKYFRELLGIEARKFIRNLSAETVQDQS